MVRILMCPKCSCCAEEISGGAELIGMALVILWMNFVTWGRLQFARGDAMIEISCCSLGHEIEDENKLGEGTEAGECHSPVNVCG